MSDPTKQIFKAHKNEFIKYEQARKRYQKHERGENFRTVGLSKLKIW